MQRGFEKKLNNLISTKSKHGTKGSNDGKDIEHCGSVLEFCEGWDVDVGEHEQDGDGELDGEDGVDFGDEVGSRVLVEISVGV